MWKRRTKIYRDTEKKASQSQLKGNLQQLKIHLYLCGRVSVCELDRVWVQNCLSISKSLILLNLVAIDIWTWLALIEIDQKARRVRVEIATAIGTKQKIY